MFESSVEKLSKMIAKSRIFPGGYRFKNFEGQSQDNLIQTGICAKIVIPLKQGFGSEVACLVEPGQKVSAGEIIARSDESVSSPIHSSANGKVVGIDKIEYLGEEITAVTIECDGSEGWQNVEGTGVEWAGLSGEQLASIVYLSGASSAGRCGIPTQFNSSIISPDEVENVIIQGVEAEVYNLSSAFLLKDEGLSHLADGIKILQKMLPKAAFHVALSNSDNSLVKKICDVLAESVVEVSTLEPRYPAHFDEVLVTSVLGLEFPYGYSAANIGVIVLDIQDVLGVWEAVVEGKPVIERTVALVGSGFKENPHAKVRIGTPLEYVVEGRTKKDQELRFIRNSCISGETLSDVTVPVTRDFDCIVALTEGTEREFMAFLRPGVDRDSYSNVFLSAIFGKKMRCETNLHGEERPCISCSYCQQVCPVKLYPHLLFQHAERDRCDEKVVSYKIYDCIECNLCSYVCVSKIPLSNYIRKGKDLLAKDGLPCPVPTFPIKGVKEVISE